MSGGALTRAYVGLYVVARAFAVNHIAPALLLHLGLGVQLPAVVLASQGPSVTAGPVGSVGVRQTSRPGHSGHVLRAVRALAVGGAWMDLVVNVPTTRL